MPDEARQGEASTPARRLRAKSETLVVAGSYLLQVGGLAGAFLVARAAGDWLLAFESNTALLLSAAAGACVLCAAAMLAVAYRLAPTNRRAKFWIPLTMTGIVGAVLFAVAEVGLRMVAQPDPLGQRIGNTVLLPYQWPAVVAANRALLERSAASTAYYVDDRGLGWTVGPSRASPDGLYASSAEGIRSAEQGVRYAEIAPVAPVALFGDSFAFSEEVPFHQSLGWHLEKVLAPTVVLNFGVPGYGIDQAWLRFRNEGIAWSPRVAILTFIEDDLYRVANVYTFLKLSWGLPFSKPRFTAQGEHLEALNMPTMLPGEIFAHKSIFDLPWLDHEIEFVHPYWREHPLHASYLLRLLVSKYPTWPAKDGSVSDQAIIAVSARIIEDFFRTATAAEIRPLVVYLPTSSDFPADRRVLKNPLISKLADRGLTVIDMTACLADHQSQGDLFMPGGHYSDRANMLIAGCLTPIITRAME